MFFSITSKCLGHLNGEWLICVLALAVSINGIVSMSMELPQTLTEDEYEVYSALLSNICSNDKNQQLVIEDQTWSYSYSDEDWRKRSRELMREINQIRQDTLDDYHTKNKQQYKLTSSFNLINRVILVHGQLEQIKEDYTKGNDGWKIFHQRFPQSKSLLTLSRVGFNQDKDQAFLLLIKQVNLSEGGAVFFLLRKANGVWKVKDSKIINLI
jgi:hypothetical protein